jgi:hypothetical protein
MCWTRFTAEGSDFAFDSILYEQNCACSGIRFDHWPFFCLDVSCARVKVGSFEQ